MDYITRNQWLKSNGFSQYSVYLESEHWKKTRKELIKKRGYKCEHCESKKDINIHHKTYERIGCEIETDLLILCKKCHVAEHNRIEIFTIRPKKVLRKKLSICCGEKLIPRCISGIPIIFICERCNAVHRRKNGKLKLLKMTAVMA